jgi:mono/diheme cytochrome c family protein
MKKIVILLSVATVVITFAAFSKRDKAAEPVFIPPSEQRTGDSATGFRYLTTGDYLKSGFPYEFFIYFNGKGTNLLNREGKNATVEHSYNVVTNADSMDIVTPNCLQCHSQVFEGKLYVGLGNPALDFSTISQQGSRMSALKVWQTTSPKKYRAIKTFLTSMRTVNPDMETAVRGVNSSDRLAALLMAHRNPQTLEWSDTAVLAIPDAVIPSDVPAWWLLKKKNALFYNGFGRGDFTRLMMLCNILTLKDSAEATEVYGHFGHMLAYIRSLQPPAFPAAITPQLAARGRKVFAGNCARCHGSYGAGGEYPNLLIPASIIQTDSLLCSSNQQAKPLLNWFGNSWFSQGSNPARLIPSNGYVAPPLDGVWITAPYLHNGSVPTIEAVLNSKLRPDYWTRDFEKPVYDYEHLGWKYEARAAPDGKKVYNTKLPGYSNSGHYFGDDLADDERRAIIEYLKTL